MEKTSLYRYFDINGNLLYIGVSINPFAREKQHRSDREMTLVRYIELEWFDDAQSAYDAEKHAIRQEKPLWNMIHKEKPRRCRVTHVPARPVVEPLVPNLEREEPSVPILRTGVIGRYFGCGDPEGMPMVPVERVYGGDENGVHRVCRVMRRGDVLISRPDAALGQDDLNGLLFGGIHHCVIDA